LDGFIPVMKAQTNEQLFAQPAQRIHR